MATLTETAYYTRRAINWTILGIIAYILLRIFWGVLIVLWMVLFPPKPIPPNHAFGKLPAVKFPEVATGSAKLTFQLETIEGGVPAASASAAVYFMPKSAPNLLGLNKAQEFATNLQLDPNPIQESKNVYRFNDARDPLRRLRYDIVSKNFILRYAFEQDASAFLNKNLPLAEAAKLEATTLLQSYDIYPEDFQKGKPTATFLRLVGNRLVTTTSLSQGDAVRVNFFRKPIGETPVVTPNPDEASISIIFSGSPEIQKRIIQLAYTYWPIDYSTIATYPLKTSSVAWEELQAGQGYIARAPTTGASSATVRSVYLAYYDSFDPQTYLQPIFVFEGDNGFVGYVPAISPEWTE
jgi:hypothetical protein